MPVLPYENALTAAACYYMNITKIKLKNMIKYAQVKQFV